MSGGVSLAKRDLLATRAPISEAVSPSMRRGALDFGASSQDGFATLSKTSYSLRAAAGRYEVRALASEEQVARQHDAACQDRDRQGPASGARRDSGPYGWATPPSVSSGCPGPRTASVWDGRDATSTPR